MERVSAPVRDHSRAQPVVGPGNTDVLNHSPEGPSGRRAAYRCQLTIRTQKAGESLQDFARPLNCLPIVPTQLYPKII
jgi:hypothetical protein